MAQNSSMDLRLLMDQIGQVGKRLSDLGAAEGAAGNISVCVPGRLGVTSLFPREQVIELPVSAPELAGATVIDTGSGRRLREIIESPSDNLACIVVEQDGRTG